MNLEIAITGASGFIGANLTAHFLAQGHHVIAIEGLSNKSWRLQSHPNLKRLRLNLCSRNEVQKFVGEFQPAILINCAAHGAYACQTDVDGIYGINFEAVRFLLESLKDVRGFNAFIQAGSSSEYGINCSAPSEDSMTLPDSDYAVSKTSATGLIEYYARKLNFPAWILRLYAVYGPLEDVSRLVPNLLIHAKEGKLPPLVNPLISRDFVYIDDVCRAFEAVIDKSAVLPRGEIYNIGTGNCTRLEDLISVVQTQFGVLEEPKWGSMPDRRWDYPNWFSNPKKANLALNWKAKVSLADGLQKTMKWISESPELITRASEQSVLRGRF
jgi:polyisoprenyl-phosphate glycosyltransferase